MNQSSEVQGVMVLPIRLYSMRSKAAGSPPAGAYRQAVWKEKGTPTELGAGGVWP